MLATSVVYTRLQVSIDVTEKSNILECDVQSGSCSVTFGRNTLHPFLVSKRKSGRQPARPSLPHFLENQLTDGGEVSLNAPAAFYLQDDFLVLISVRN
jgi:hypothetical protein